MIPLPMDDKWIDNVREKMSEFETTPPEGLWDSIQDGLNTRKTRWWKILAPVAAASIALLIGGYFALAPVGTTLQEGPAICYATIEPEDPAGVEKTDAETLTDENAPIAELMPDKKSRLPHASHTISTTVPVHNIEFSESINPEGEARTPEINVPEINPNERERLEDSDIFDNELYAYVETNDGNGKSRFAIGLSTSADGMGGMMNDPDFGHDPYHQIYAAETPDSRMGGGIYSDADLNTPPDGSDKPTPSPVEVFDHKIPMRYALNLSFPVYRNLTIDTGLAYSYLKSDIRYGDTDNGIRNGQQKLHFLGLPISIRYTPLSRDHFDGYVSGGVMVEKCIGGTLDSDAPHGIAYSYPGCEERPWQFSLNAGVGVQYNLAKECGIYLEPGLSIYIKNGSRLRTIYNERPVTFNLNIGVRFSTPKK